MTAYLRTDECLQCERNFFEEMVRDYIENAIYSDVWVGVQLREKSTFCT